MLSTKFRLTKTNDINNVHTNGEAFFTRHFVVKFVKNNLSYSRFTILISAKVSKRATVRNRIKRVLREGVRLAWKKIKPGYDIIFIVSKKSVGSDDKPVTREELWQSVNFVLNKSKLST